jgi:hypothetical protein
MMMNFRKCKSMNYIFATETILTSTTGTGHEGGSSHFVQAILGVQYATQPLQTPCHT